MKDEAGGQNQPDENDTQRSMTSVRNETEFSPMVTMFKPRLMTAQVTPLPNSHTQVYLVSHLILIDNSMPFIDVQRPNLSRGTSEHEPTTGRPAT